MDDALVDVTQADIDAGQRLLDRQHDMLRRQGAEVADATVKPDGMIVQALAQARLAGVKEGLESAYREGFNDARRCLSDDEAFCLTEDVEQDAWLDSETHRSLGPRP